MRCHFCSLFQMFLSYCYLQSVLSLLILLVFLRLTCWSACLVIAMLDCFVPSFLAMMCRQTHVPFVTPTGCATSCTLSSNDSIDGFFRLFPPVIAFTFAR